MPGKATHLSPLQSRKQLLLAESELNRAQLAEEWRVMARGVGELAHLAKIAAAWGSAGALLAAGVTAWRRRSPVHGTTKSSWLPKILNGARAASAVWLAFRARGEKPEPK